MSFVSFDTKQVPIFLGIALAGGIAGDLLAKKMKSDSPVSYIVAGILLPIAIVGSIQEYRLRKLNKGNGFSVISIPPVLPPVAATPVASSGSIGTS